MNAAKPVLFSHRYHAKGDLHPKRTNYFKAKMSELRFILSIRPAEKSRSKEIEFLV